MIEYYRGYSNPRGTCCICDYPPSSIDIAIQNEIRWCKDNPLPEKVTPDFRDGFIKGLEQALYLINQAAMHGRA